MPDQVIVIPTRERLSILAAKIDASPWASSKVVKCVAYGLHLLGEFSEEEYALVAPISDVLESARFLQQINEPLAILLKQIAYQSNRSSLDQTRRGWPRMYIHLLFSQATHEEGFREVVKRFEGGVDEVLAVNTNPCSLLFLEPGAHVVLCGKFMPGQHSQMQSLVRQLWGNPLVQRAVLFYEVYPS